MYEVGFEFAVFSLCSVVIELGFRVLRVVIFVFCERVVMLWVVKVGNDGYLDD